MSKKIITEDLLTKIADAIRAKTGKTDKLTPAQMAEEITSIKSGGTIDKLYYVDFLLNTDATVPPISPDEALTICRKPKYIQNLFWRGSPYFDNHYTDSQKSVIRDFYPKIDFSNIQGVTSCFGNYLEDGLYPKKLILTGKAKNAFYYAGADVLDLSDWECAKPYSIGTIFYNCIINTLIIGEKWNPNITAENGCSFKCIIIKNPSRVVGIDNTIQFSDLKQGKGVYVPDNLVNDYKTATNWSEFADCIHPLSEYKEA